MTIKRLMLGIPIFLCATMLITSGPVSGNTTADTGSPQAVSANQDSPVAKGKILGMSNKAKTITIEDSSLGLVMLKFDDDTVGLEHAQKGEAAIISFKVSGDDKIATIVKPKLAKLPKGVTEIMPEELAEMVAGGADFVLIDSRPGKPYAEGHIPTAISIPVEEMATLSPSLLPQDHKDKLLIFYCGGPT